MIGPGAGKAGTMRGGGYLVVLAGVAALAAGCGTQRAQAVNVNVAAAAAGTASQRARVTVIDDDADAGHVSLVYRDRCV